MSDRVRWILKISMSLLMIVCGIACLFGMGMLFAEQDETLRKAGVVAGALGLLVLAIGAGTLVNTLHAPKDQPLAIRMGRT